MKYENGDIIFIKQNRSLYNKWGKRPAIVEGVFDDGVQCSSFDDGETMYSIPFKNIVGHYKFNEKEDTYSNAYTNEYFDKTYKE